MSTTAIASPFATIAEAVEEIRAGRMVVVVDDADRENEGDLTVAASKITPEIINFMARHGRGLICAALTEERLAELRIPLMTQENTSNFGTAFCETVDARRGVTTGISAADRALSIQALVAPETRPDDLARPGHIFPLRARPGGVLTRAGQTEAAVDLARLAGLPPAGVICEIMNEDGSMARVPELDRFCRLHGLKMVTVADLIRHRSLHERYLLRWAESSHRTAHGEARWVVYRNQLDGEFASALVFGSPDWGRPVLVRVQAHCLAASLGSVDCQCGRNLQAAMERIQAAGGGVIVYLHQSGPGMVFTEPAAGLRGLAHDQPDPAVQRQTGLGAQILSDLGARQIRLLTDHPRRLPGLEGFGLEVVEQVPLTHERAPQ